MNPTLKTVILIILSGFLFVLTSATNLFLPEKNVSPKDEAQLIALDTTGDLLPDPQLTIKIEKSITSIRGKFLQLVGNVRNQGRWALGSALITNHDSELKDKISASSFGPLQSFQLVENKTSQAQFIFQKPFNPSRLCSELEKLGAEAQPIWYDTTLLPDLGDISLDLTDSTYTFRQGLFNCGLNCTANHFWVFKIEEKEGGEEEITIDSEYITSIPQPNIIQPEETES